MARRARLHISVSGGNTCTRETARLAHAVGRALAEAGAIVVCGGRSGVMEATARGVRERGGIVVGILPGYDRRAGNPHLTATIPTGLGHARNMLVAAAGDALIALPGKHGTLSEVALARVLGRPVVALGAWDGVANVRRARDAAEAVRLVLTLARRRRRPRPR
jgi:uncharacterized protein (TIGR00725 family)